MNGVFLLDTWRKRMVGQDLIPVSATFTIRRNTLFQWGPSKDNHGVQVTPLPSWNHT